ncbi:CaiB/BaiF CoA transferase family protein [Chelatococcus reniformis]|uniref:CoA transferase n=1 Tax=Chelatococcus reniformis TaxID=1494448 RepID=A0A916USD8_9HYPH|nr:CaiB/BaiF CoA-transferase family protein [Chelatococcus reniformis]GGC86102.1 CoA transferase [Chelatococcus reniformis]
MRDLEGILVVSIEQAVAAPYASSRLADAGARVIKVERRDGDFARGYDRYAQGQSSYFVWLNRGKQSIAVDLREADDIALLRRMIGTADIFIQNAAPGVMASLGLDPVELRRADPRLITCTITGYGEDGPLKDLKAYDLLVQGETGLAEITGNAAGPGRVGVSVCDIAAGMTALNGIQQALIGRARTGVGRHVSVSLFHALADWMNVPFLQFAYGGHTPARMGLNHPTIAPYGAYACRCGQAILFSIQNEREWAKLCSDVLGKPGLAQDPRFADNNLRVANRPALDVEIDAVLSALDRQDVVERMERARIAYGRINSLADLAEHAQARFVEIATPGGPVRMLAPGALHDGAVLTADGVPALDENGEALRAEFE